MSDDLTNLTHQVMGILQQIDRETTSFQTVTGLQCPTGCGRCCQNPEVETTPLEMLPVVMELFRQQEVEQWFSQALAKQEQGVCVFYKPDPLIDGNGYCQVYAWRPSLCRLFGFAAIANKQGQPELAACKRHKEVTPQVVSQAQKAIATGVSVPIFSNFTEQLANLDPHQGRSQMPINRALKVAIEWVGLAIALSEESAYCE